MPIIATVPAWAGATALIAVPPWGAPGGLERHLASRVCGPQDVPPREADESGLRRLQREREDEPVERHVTDAPDDLGDPAPQVT
jgi:hypothetical protein